MLSELILKLKQGLSLSQEDCFNMQSLLLEGDFKNQELVDIFKYLEGFQLKDFQLSSFVRASQQKMLTVSTKLETLDIVGTGGDGLNTFNISTTASFVAASLGISVAKHGNRAATGLCGSADLLEELGCNIELTPEQANEVLEKSGFVFLFAKSFNPAFRFVAQARKEYGRKTYFNILGPLLNPTHPKFLLLGLNDFSKAQIMAKVLIDSGVKRAWIVQSETGMDEISPIGLTKVLQLIANHNSEPITKEFTINPQEYGFSGCSLDQIQGGKSIQNAKIFKDILQAKGNPAQNATVILNTAAALVIAGKIETYSEAIFLAKQSLESGKCWDQFIKYRDISNQV